jgi:hypothetical protein
MKPTHLKTPVFLRNFKSAFFAFALLGTFASGCVTVNVNFPESAVQKASDDYVRDLYQSKNQSRSSVPKATATPVGDSAFIHPSTLMDFLIPTTQAAEVVPSFNMASPKIAAIKEKMRALVPDIIDQKKAGVLGENSEGKLVIKDASKLKPLLKKKIEDLVQEDGKLRDSLYSEVISSNHLPSNSLPAVRKSFMHSFQAASPSGTWLQNADGSWVQKQ